MAASLGELVVSIAGDIAQLELAMSRAELVTARTAKKIEDAMEVANKAVVGLAAGFVGFKGLQALEDGITGAIEAAANLERLSKQSATSAEQLSKLNGVAKQSNTDIGAVARGLAILSKNMLDTAAGTGKARDTIASLKLSVKDSNGQLKDGADFLVEIAKKTSNMSNETQRLGALQKLLKGSGVELSEFLDKLATAGDLNAKVTNRQAWEAEQYEKTLIKLTGVKRDFYNMIAQQVTPALTALVRTYIDLATGTGSLNAKTKELAAENKIREWAVNAGIGIAMVVDGFRYVALGIKIVGDAAVAVGAVFIGAFDIIGKLIGTLSASTSDFAQVLAGVGLILTGKFTLGADLIQGAIGRLKAGWVGFGEDVKADMAALGDELGTLSDDIDGMLGAFKESQTVDAFLEQLNKVGDGFTEVAKKGRETTTIVTTFKKDAIDNLTSSLLKSTAQLVAEITSMQMLGRSTKETTVATTAAVLAEMERNGTLAEHARRTGESVEATKKRVLGLAGLEDILQGITVVEKAHIDALQKEHDATMAAADNVTALRDQLATYNMLPAAVTRYNMARLQEKLDAVVLWDTEGKLTAELRERLVLMGQLANMQDSGQAMKDQVSMWTQVGDLVGNFAKEIVTNAGGAINWLRNQMKGLLADMIALFMRRWVLQMVGSAVGGDTGNALTGAAAQAGMGTISSGLLNMLGVGSGAGGIGAYLFGSPGVASVGGAIEGYTSGLIGTGGFSATIGTAAGAVAEAFGATAASASALSATVAAAVPIIGWVVAIGAVLYSMFGGKGGGPKSGGSFFGAFDEQGQFLHDALAPGTQNGRFFTPSDQDTSLHDAMLHQGEGYAQFVRSLGGSGARALQFGLGVDSDPSGNAGARIEAMVADSAGNIIYHAMHAIDKNNVGAEAGLEMKREMVAALQATDISPYIDAIFDKLGDITKLTGEQLDKVLKDAVEMAGVLQGLTTLGQGKYSLALTVEELGNFQLAGESIGQTFQRVGGAWSNLVNNFSSDADKMDAAQAALTKLYGTMADMGITAPKTREDWLHVMQGLDLTTEAGRSLFAAMLQMAPAFDAVATAAAKMMDSFDQIMGRMRPGYTDNLAKLTNDSNIAAFMANNPWTQGMNPAAVMGQILTITREDFSQYSSANQQLILQILGFADSMSKTKDQLEQVRLSYVQMVQTGAGAGTDYIGNLGGVFTGDFKTRIPAVIKTVDGEIARLQAALEQPGAVGTTDWVANQTKMTTLQGFRVLQQQDLNRYWEMEAVSPGHGEDLLKLEKWYADSKLLMVGNTQGMLQLEDEFQRRRTDIITKGVKDANTAMDSFKSWRDGLLGDKNLSPLTLQQQFVVASSDYASTLSAVQGGDTAQLGTLQTDGQRYLELARQLFASSPTYMALFRQVMLDTGGIVGETQADTNARLSAAIPSKGQLASSEDIKVLNSNVADIATLLSQVITTSDPTAAAALGRIADEIRRLRQSGVLAPA